MGTRGAFGFRFEGEEKVMYNHYDSYPSFLGKAMLEFCNKYSIAEMKKLFREIKMVKQDAKPTREDFEKYKSEEVEGIGYRGDYYSLLRFLQGQPELLFENPIMTDDREFLGDSLFCEWAYIIDLDVGVLEIYKGFNTDRNSRGPYVQEFEPYVAHDKTIFYGVELLFKLSLPEAGEQHQITTTDDIRPEELEGLAEGAVLRDETLSIL